MSEPIEITFNLNDLAEQVYDQFAFGTAPARKKPVSLYKIDKEAVEDACDFLGIRQQVKVFIRYLHGAAHWGWCPEYHRIVVNPYLIPEEAEAAVWHELTHAQQMERFGSHDIYVMFYNRQFARSGLTKEVLKRPLTVEETAAYRSIPLEAEAYEREQNIPDGIRICVPR
jgi:hypothetical protein